MKIIFITICASFLLPSSATAQKKTETIDDWLLAAQPIVEFYEGSTFASVTPNFDKQGLSLGVLQFTVGSGSLNDLVKEVGIPKSKELAKKLMPTFGDKFSKIIDLRLQGKSVDAVKLSEQLQAMDGGKFVMLPNAKKELSNWLTSPEVTAAQRSLVKKKANSALIATKAWKQTHGQKRDAPVEFKEFIFFYDLAIQGGLGGFSPTGQTYANACSLLKSNQFNDPDIKSKRIEYLAQWMSTKWKPVGNVGYYKDAAINASLLEKKKGSISDDELFLLYMKLHRASAGNPPYRLLLMNRGVLSLFGEGAINGQNKDFTKIYQARLPLAN